MHQRSYTVNCYAYCIYKLQYRPSIFYPYRAIQGNLWKAPREAYGELPGKLLGTPSGSSLGKLPGKLLRHSLKKLVWNLLRSSPGDHWSSSLVRETPRGVRGIPCSFWRLLEAPGGHPETLRDCAGVSRGLSEIPIKDASWKAPLELPGVLGTCGGHWKVPWEALGIGHSLKSLWGIYCEGEGEDPWSPSTFQENLGGVLETPCISWRLWRLLEGSGRPFVIVEFLGDFQRAYRL